jgi:hypothetical protein
MPEILRIARELAFLELRPSAIRVVGHLFSLVIRDVTLVEKACAPPIPSIARAESLVVIEGYIGSFKSRTE